MIISINLSKIVSAVAKVLPLFFASAFLWLAYAYVSLDNTYKHAAFQIAVHQAEALDAIAQGFGKGTTS